MPTMEKRFFTFLVLAMLIMVGNSLVMRWLFPPAPVPPQAADQQVAVEPGDEKAADAKKPEIAAPADVAQPAAPAVAGADAPQVVAPAAAAPAEDAPIAPQWTTLGSLDPDGPYRMLVTFTNRGAAVQLVELNNPRYQDVDNLRPLGGYLGHLEPTDVGDEKGCTIQVVGPGTPAEQIGLQPGDILTKINDDSLADAQDFLDRMRQTKPGDKLTLAVTRDGKPQTFDVTLRPHPLEVLHREVPDPENPQQANPPSFVLTLDRLDDKTLDIDKDELPGVALRDVNWEVLPSDVTKPNEVAFRRTLTEKGVEIVKRYTLLTRDPALKVNNAQPYTLMLKVEMKNIGAERQKLAYRLDGPTGLPVEGYWYARGAKIGPVSGAGMRDVVHGIGPPDAVEDGMQVTSTIADGTAPLIADPILNYVGVDSQYFAAILIPQLADPLETRFTRIKPIRVGPVPVGHPQLTDVSFRLTRRPVDMEPNETGINDEFKIYLGPKSPELLADYGLDSMIDYGWFDFVAKPMLVVMHFFYGIVGNYGIAIILLTLVVRSAMFPLSRKQALNAMKMQELQPEIKRIAEKYKSSPEQRMKAQQELFRKHKYNPFSGCLPIFVQLPIFIGLYRSLAVDVELRQAPLISENIRWASNLAAPDMFWYWEPYLPTFLAGENGWLGPFLNLLPLVTIVLFLVQQKMFMPPPTDEQSAMQQKMMKYMMIVMGFMFFKVPAGLCVYFITSSIWSICERKMLPKPKPAEPVGQAVLNVEAKPSSSERKAKRK